MYGDEDDVEPVGLMVELDVGSKIVAYRWRNQVVFAYDGEW